MPVPADQDFNGGLSLFLMIFPSKLGSRGQIPISLNLMGMEKAQESREVLAKFVAL